MKKINLIISIALATAGLSANALGAEYYGGAEAGVAIYSDFGHRVTDISRVDKGQVNYGVFAGVAFDNNLSAEVLVSSLGDAQLKNYDGGFKERGIEALASYNHSLSDNIDLIASAGARFYQWDAYGKDVYEDENSVAPMVGLGLKYKLTDRISARAQAKYYMELGGVNAVSVNTGLIYQWGAGSPDVLAHSERDSFIEPSNLELSNDGDQGIEVSDDSTVNVAPAKTLHCAKTSVRDYAPFDFASPVSSVLEKTIKDLANIAENNPGSIVTISGHTDSKGAVDFNQRLSEKRVLDISKRFAKYGVDSKHFAYGELKPIATNETDEGRAANRMTEIVISGVNECVEY